MQSLACVCAAQEAVLGMAWVGDCLVLALPTTFRLVMSGTPSVDVAVHGASHPLLATHPFARQIAMLVQDDLVNGVSGSGA